MGIIEWLIEVAWPQVAVWLLLPATLLDAMPAFLRGLVAGCCLCGFVIYFGRGSHVRRLSAPGAASLTGPSAGAALKRSANAAYRVAFCRATVIVLVACPFLVAFLGDWRVAIPSPGADAFFALQAQSGVRLTVADPTPGWTAAAGIALLWIAGGLLQLRREWPVSSAHVDHVAKPGMGSQGEAELGRRAEFWKTRLSQIDGAGRLGKVQLYLDPKITHPGLLGRALVLPPRVGVWRQPEQDALLLRLLLRVCQADAYWLCACRCLRVVYWPAARLLMGFEQQFAAAQRASADDAALPWYRDDLGYRRGLQKMISDAAAGAIGIDELAAPSGPTHWLAVRDGDADDYRQRLERLQHRSEERQQGQAFWAEAQDPHLDRVFWRTVVSGLCTFALVGWTVAPFDEEVPHDQLDRWWNETYGAGADNPISPWDVVEANMGSVRSDRSVEELLQKLRRQSRQLEQPEAPPRQVPELPPAPQAPPGRQDLQ